MIVRCWTARATPQGARDYAAFFERALAPKLRELAGHRGSLVLQRENETSVEILVMTSWESPAAIDAFAGADREAAVVEPEAAALLLDYDRRVKHYLAAFESR
ncbi:MAG: antibiotic biosynthesis monooxygenase [Candidatus Eremiobacteraeota bacterium]|nr:antibiotic biosynthesis monooxygenase [Candidatus Eremiobacteraeota bacterium]